MNPKRHREERASLGGLTRRHRELRSFTNVGVATERWRKWGVIAQFSAAVVSAVLVLLIYLQTKEMTEQTTAAIRQTEESIATRELMVQQLEQMQMQTLAIVETNRPVLVIKPTKPVDFMFQDGLWIMYLNVLNKGTRPAFDPLLRFETEFSGRQLIDSSTFATVQPGVPSVWPVLAPPLSDFTLHLELEYARKEVIVESLEYMPFRLTRNLSIRFESEDTTWHAKVNPPNDR